MNQTLHEQKPSVQNTLDDLTYVGERKLMGWLSLKKLSEECHADPVSLQKNAEAKGLKALVLSEEETRNEINRTYVESGMLFVYDQSKLQDFLLLPKNKDILTRSGWPTNVDSFIRQVASVDAPYRADWKPREAGALYDLIALAFNDPRPEYRIFKEYRGGPAVPHYFQGAAPPSEICSAAPTIKGTIGNLLKCTI